MNEEHNLVLANGRHFSLPGPVPAGVTLLSANGKAFRLTGDHLCEYAGAIAYVTWAAELVDIDSLDPNLTRARD